MRLSVFISMILFSAALAGPELDRARRTTAVASAALNEAARVLEEARTADDKIRFEMDRIRDKQRDLDRELDRLRDLRRDLPDRVRAEEARLPKLLEDAIAAAEQVAKMQGPLREMIDRAKITLAKVKEVRAKYVKQFEISEPYQHALIRCELAAKFEAATQRAVLDRVRASATYKSAEDAHRSARGRQATIRLNADAATTDRIAAANLVIQTESAVRKIEIDALVADDSLQLATADARRKESALAAMIEQFERDVPRQPDMAEAMARHERAQAAADEADAALSRAEGTFAAAKAAVSGSKAAMAKYNDAQLKTEADILAALRTADDQSRDLDRLSKRLADTGAAATRAQREFELADRRYREARAYENVAARIDAQNAKTTGP